VTPPKISPLRVVSPVDKRNHSYPMWQDRRCFMKMGMEGPKVNSEPAIDTVSMLISATGL
jgi:hypothetical protein